MRCSLACALIALVGGCSGKSSGGDDTTEPDPKGWTIDIDMSATNRYVDPMTSTTWPVRRIVNRTPFL